jgi:peptidoglycan/xylan/chitin deacetylase (PgdA/CDA1 family)
MHLISRRDFGLAGAAAAAAPVPPKTVVLTFDDAVKSHRTVVAPLLKRLGFRATFFVTHRWMEQKDHFLSWQDAAEIHAMGFEIGNHSWTHADFSTPRAAARLAGELALVEYELRRVNVPKPVSFAWSGNGFGPESVAVLRESGIRYARRGAQPEAEYGRIVVGPAFDPRRHHPLLIPTTGDAYPDWTFEHFQKVMGAAKAGEMVVLQFHGVPDVVHPWVHTPPPAFEKYMEYLRAEGFRTLALRDVGEFLGPEPDDPVLRMRYRQPKDGKLALPPEVEATQRELPYWRAAMRTHGYTAAEAARVTGMAETERRPTPARGIQLLPYPGGRHTRIGFLDGAVDPMRGTKASVFLPWADAGYIVVDVPEAVIANGKIHFLGHTHIPTKWDEKNVVIANRDWARNPDGSLASEWELPDKVTVGATVRLNGQVVEMECWIRNGSTETLQDMRAQVCVLFRGAPAFAAQSNANKQFAMPRAMARSADGQRWIATEWEDCQRVWGNERCPCMHSDPKFPDCAPGETVRRKGRIWFGTVPAA